MGNLLVLDIGGTFIKYGLADANGLLPDTVRQAPSCAEESAPAFLNNLRSILQEAQKQGPLDRACACIGGPFDFDQGIPWMKHKFESLYGQSIQGPFADAQVPVTFLHDSTAFMLGEYHFGSLSGTRNACCVMLGTGLGFAWVKDEKVCLDVTQTPSLALWKTPYLDGIAEDYVSTRAIQRYYGEALPVKEIADLARAGDQKAADAFLTEGRHLSHIMSQVTERLGCEKLALGGQIAKSAELFHLALPIPWSITAHPEEASLQGMIQYARMGREKATQTVLLQFDTLH